jgi:hypothetical protein
MLMNLYIHGVLPGLFKVGSLLHNCRFTVNHPVLEAICIGEWGNAFSCANERQTFDLNYGYCCWSVSVG